MSLILARSIVLISAVHGLKTAVDELQGGPHSCRNSWIDRMGLDFMDDDRFASCTTITGIVAQRFWVMTGGAPVRKN